MLVSRGMDAEEVATRFFKLKFDLERGRRYYGAMRNRCAALSLALQAVIALSASATFLGMLAEISPALQRGFGLCAAATSCLALAKRAGKRADLYTLKLAKFSALLMEFPEDPARWSVDLMERLTKSRLAVEADEGPLCECLDVICHNQLCLATGREEQMRPLSWFQEHVLKYFPVRYKPPRPGR